MVTLEDAERLFSGKSQSILWWAQLRTLQLRVYAEHHFLDPVWANFEKETTDQQTTKQGTTKQEAADQQTTNQKANGQRKFPNPDHPSRRFRTLAFRLQRSHAPYIQELFKQGISIASDSRDLYLFVRVLNYFLLAHRHATNADELQRDPAADLQKAERSHRKEVVDLLNTACHKWCPKLFEDFADEVGSGGLLDKYCKYVDDAYKDAGCPIPRVEEAESGNQPSNKSGSVVNPKVVVSGKDSPIK